MLSPETPALHWPLLERLPQRLAGDPFSAPLYRDSLSEAHAELAARFHAEEPIDAIVHARAQLIDVVLRAAWRAHLGDDADRWALVAVGGYGRGELHPCSDIDVLVLTPEPLSPAGRGPVERLLAFLWDIGLEIGHSVRTLAECASESAADVSVMTTLVEARLLAGDEALVLALREA
ncbi:MAG: nucleotidyltransferase domain-containing protein, partial [Steroidobacteraceae bacterium]|nr:nucleotidyltransferase domain-containing protein [Steroidobacteraceae bacterium]